MDLTFAKDRLTQRFAGRISTEAVSECLEDEARSIGKGARIRVFIPILAEHAARDRLAASIQS